jgi:AmiR/NasT family two-component response regulator
LREDRIVMTRNLGFVLIDGPVIDSTIKRKAKVEQMAKDLVRYDAFHNEADAIRSLFGRGYGMADIVMLVDDARQVAMQDVVAREMAKS